MLIFQYSQASPYKNGLDILHIIKILAHLVYHSVKLFQGRNYGGGLLKLPRYKLKYKMFTERIVNEISIPRGKPIYQKKNTDYKTKLHLYFMHPIQIFFHIRVRCSFPNFLMNRFNMQENMTRSVQQAVPGCSFLRAAVPMS